ncbi:MAG: D-sedoheptulose 7-phosphate isomerase [Desulfobacterales bacterium]|nr:D-sedoheptulose 7-phosphate isomerase [Desulfobacterales bacterium]
MQDIVLQILKDSIQVKEACIHQNMNVIIEAAQKIAQCVSNGNKVLIFGNGGSAADAQHIAAEFINRFQMERPPLAAIALTTDTSVITSIGNDYHFNEIFLKQVQALGRPNDIAWGISTSGNSKNVVLAMEAAKSQGLYTLGFTGYGGRLAEISDLVFTVPSKVTARIQESHITLGHILCDLLERHLFPEKVVV